MGRSWNRNELIDYSISIYNLNELLLNIPLLVYMPSNEQSIRVPLPTTRDNLKKYIDDDFILDGKSNEKLPSTHMISIFFIFNFRIWKNCKHNRNIWICWTDEIQWKIFLWINQFRTATFIFITHWYSCRCYYIRFCKFLALLQSVWLLDQAVFLKMGSVKWFHWNLQIVDF